MNLRKWLLSFLLILVFFPVFAQEQKNVFDEYKSFYGGLVLGLNATQVDGDTYAGYHRVGLNAGGIVYWRFVNQVALSLEILYSQKGSRAVKESTSPYAGSYFSKYSIKLNYAEVPLMFHYFFSSKYQIGFGGSFNGLISSKESLIQINPVHIDESLFPFNKFHVDLMGSISMAVWKGLVLDVRFQYGITPLRDYQNVPFGYGSSNQFDNMFTFRIQYLF